MFCAICYHLYNLKNVKNTHGGALLLVKLQADFYMRATLALNRLNITNGLIGFSLCFSRFG